MSASEIYSELERQIATHGPDTVKRLMPPLVALLEQLDSSSREQASLTAECDLLREDAAQLLSQYEREKQLRRTAEQVRVFYTRKLIKNLSFSICALTREFRAIFTTLRVISKIALNEF